MYGSVNSSNTPHTQESLRIFHLALTASGGYYKIVRQSREAFRKEGWILGVMDVSEALIRAILELIDKCETLEELRESIKRIVGDK